jgi:hypothetical protein
VSIGGAYDKARGSRDWAHPSCSACLRIVERRYGYRPGDDIVGPLGRGVVDAVFHADDKIHAMATFAGGFIVTVEASELSKDPDGESARKTATWILGRG